MKLQLEHIQGYLAHGLKVKNLNPYNDYSGGKEILTVNGTYYLYPKDEEPILFMSFNEHPSGKSCDSCTPIIRKLDLTKPILKNGIIPAIEVAKFMDNGHNHTDSKVRIYSGVLIISTNKCDDVHDVRISFSNNIIYSIKMDGNDAMFETSKRIRNWLYANKFDVDGLIDAGLSVDADTLEINPYNT